MKLAYDTLCQFFSPADIAVDWVANNLYVSELSRREILVLDFDSRAVVSLLQAPPDETFRAIALDPTRRCILHVPSHLPD